VDRQRTDGVATMPRKKKVKAPESATSEPVALSAVLEQSPVAEMIASQEAKAEPERTTDGEEAVAAFKRQRERDLAVDELPPPQTEVIPSGPRGPRISDAEPTPDTEARSHVQRLSEPRGLRPTPKGFRGEEGHYHAGVRLSRSLDKNVVAIQFSDDRKPTRDGENSEKEQLESRGFLYVPMRTQWERVDREQPAENYQDAKVLVESLVRDRLAKPAAEVGR
jgi:hypothetical protein